MNCQNCYKLLNFIQDFRVCPEFDCKFNGSLSQTEAQAMCEAEIFENFQNISDVISEGDLRKNQKNL